jgi:hypothetical protein
MIDMEELILGLGVCGLPPSALPGISPTGGEIESWQGLAEIKV